MGSLRLPLRSKFGTFAPLQSVPPSSSFRLSAKPLTPSPSFILQVSEQYNITYAGQTLGGSWESDGTLKNDRKNITISCDQTNGNCPIPVYAPSIALVFLTDEAYTESTPSVDSKVEYSTTVQGATATLVPSSVLETSNGHGGKQWTVKLGSTSNESGSSSGAEGRLSLGGAGVALALVAVGGLTALL